MIFSSNENLLINLLNYSDFISSKYLANRLFVSTKTIYRIVKRINNISMESHENPLIVSEPGKGFKLNQHFRNQDIHKLMDFTEENNLNDLILSFLFKHPKKVKRTVFDEEYLSESSIERRLKKMQDNLNQYHIRLHYDWEYIWLEGEEINIRRAINDIFLEINKINSLNEIGVKINQIDKFFIDKQITVIEESLNEYLSYPYDLTVYTHIYMIIKRYREGEVKYLSSQEPLEKDEEQLMLTNRKITKTAQTIIKNLEDYLGIKMSELEVYFAFQNIYSINIQKRESSNIDKKLAEEIAKHYITNFFSISDVTLLPASRSLYQDLYQHLLPMLSRLRMGIKIENNLLDEVVLEYEGTFRKLTKITETINNELMFDTKINDAEIGYLTLYFEKYKINRRETKNILLVCSTGIGTSELLRTRVESNFPNLNVVATMSQRQMKNNQTFIKENVDLIFSTLRMPFDLGTIPVLTISPLLTEKDIQHINLTLKELE